MLEVPTGFVNSRVASASEEVVVFPSPAGNGSSATSSGTSSASPPSTSTSPSSSSSSSSSSALTVPRSRGEASRPSRNRLDNSFMSGRTRI